MKNIEVTRQKQRLDSLFKRIKDLPDEIELQSHWARYLCILVSGFMETSIRAIFHEYAQSQASPNIVNFVEGQLRSFQNPKMEKILGLTRLFSPEWEADLRKATEGELKDAVDSIVANRNNIAHGQNVGITYVRILEYYKSAVKVIELIEKQCNKR